MSFSKRKPRFDEVLYEETKILLPAEQGFIRATYDNGRLWAHYRDQSITGTTKAELYEAAAALDEEARLKRERQKAIADARANALPAMDTEFKPLEVRGIHATTGKALVTFASGKKGDLDKSRVLRVLTPEEQARLVALREEADRLKAAIPDLPKYQEVIESLGLGNPTARFNSDRDISVLTLPDGTEVETTEPATVYAGWLRAKVGETYPLFLDSRVIKPVVVAEGTDRREVVSGYDYVIRSEAEGQEYLDALERSEQARVEVNKIVAEYRFDFGPLQERGV